LTVKIVTDSTADLPEDIIREMDITVVPLSVHFGPQTYLDGVDLKADEFYEMLAGCRSLPTTSQPAPAAFAEVYQKLGNETCDILSIHISPKLSGTYNSALLAREGLNGNCRIEIIDSLQASMGLGLIVIRAARAVQNGATLDEAIEVVRETIPHTHFFGTVDTLEYLQKGGRIGKAQALMGTLLSIKPLIGMGEGEVQPKGKTRTRKKAIAQLLEYVHGFDNIEEIALLHSTTPDDLAPFVDGIGDCCEPGRIRRSRIGPVIGTYLGPGALAIGVVEGNHRPA